MDSDHCNVGFLRSIFEFMKPTCLRTEKNKWKSPQNEHQYHQLKVVIKKRTLEELIFSDLHGNNDDRVCASNGGEYNIFRQSLKRICPPLREDCVDFTPKARESVSIEKLLKVDEEVIHSGETDVSSMSRSQSGKVRKRVSFKFPSEADIIIFYSSDVESDQD